MCTGLQPSAPVTVRVMTEPILASVFSATLWAVTVPSSAESEAFRPAALRICLASAALLPTTPGTVTVSLGEDVLCVYALRPELAEGLAQCGFVTRLRRLEGGEDHG